MKGLRKISPVEFRLSQKLFVLPYSPVNYYEKFKSEILLQKVMYSYFSLHGILIFVQKFQEMDHSIVLQFYFYHTKIMRPFKRQHSFNFHFSGCTKRKKSKKKKKKKKKQKRKLFRLYKLLDTMPHSVFHFLQNHWRLLAYSLMFILKSKKKKKRLYRSFKVKRLRLKTFRHPILFYRGIKLKYKRSLKRWKRHYGSKKYPKRWKPRWKKKRYFKRRGWKPRWWNRRARFWWRKPFKRRKYRSFKRVTSFFSFHFFFTQFFNYYFSKTAVILYKSLYKLLHQNKVFRNDLRTVLHRSRFLRKHIGSFDMLVSIHYMFTFFNTNFLFPLMIQDLTKSRKHNQMVSNLFNTLRLFYVIKPNIKAINIFIKGTYDKHARLRSQLYSVGQLALVPYKACIIYDALQCPTFYGVFFFKIWIYWVEKS